MTKWFVFVIMYLLLSSQAFAVNAITHVAVADSGLANFNPLFLSGGYWRDRMAFAVRADNGTAYLVVDNKHTAEQDIDVWLSSDGSAGRNGGNVQKYVWAMPDSIALTAGTATTLAANFVYLTYNAGSPALKRHAAEDQRSMTGGMIDSMAFIANVNLGAVSGDDEQVRSFITNQPSLYKDVMRSAFHTEPAHHEDIVPTVESHSFKATRGFMRSGRNYELIPAVNTDDVYLHVPVYNDSNYARWDSLDNFAEYADGDAIGVPHYFWVVIWGSISEDTTQYKLYMNIQTGTHTYLTRETAEQDKYNMMPSLIPEAFHETGFLIVGVIIRKSNNEVQSLEDGSTYLDLRGLISGTRGGGGAPPTDSAQIDAWNFGYQYNWLDSANACAGWGLETTAIGDDSLHIDSTDIAMWNLWTETYDSIAAWLNLVNDDRDSVLAFSPLVNEAKDSLISWTNKINADFMYNDGDTVSGIYVFNGSVGIGDASPSQAFVVGDGDDFQVTSIGAVSTTGSVNFYNSTSLKIPSDNNPIVDSEGEIAMDINDDAIEVYSGDEAESGLIPFYDDKAATIYTPDGVNDTIIFKRFDALRYPHGVEIDLISITTRGDAAYTLTLAEYSSAWEWQATTDSIVQASGFFTSDGTPMDNTIDTGDYLTIFVPATDVDQLHVEVYFHIKAGN